jgi:hypothetical protein
VKGKGVEGVSDIFDQPAAFKRFSASPAKHLKFFAYPTAGRRQKIFG